MAADPLRLAVHLGRMIGLLALSILGAFVDCQLDSGANAPCRRHVAWQHSSEETRGLSSSDGADASINRTPAGAEDATQRIDGTRRGQPRISKTRCAMITCEPQCNLKGIRDPNGDLVYRTPASPFYGPTNPDRLFCSEAEAVTAGYQLEKQS